MRTRLSDILDKWRRPSLKRWMSEKRVVAPRFFLDKGTQYVLPYELL